MLCSTRSMDFGKSNHVVPNSNIRDFDLNKLPCMEELDVNTENECSTHIHVNTPHNDSEAVAANNSAAGASSDDIRHSRARYYVSSICFGPDGSARGMLGGRRRYRRRGGVLLQSDPNRYCTNYYCRTRKTPLWRKGPLGPKTLCNACGIDYMKQVTSKGSGITTFPDTVAVVPAANDDASPSAVPAEGSDYSKGSSDV